jgi:3-phosphoglycerate kinase
MTAAQKGGKLNSGACSVCGILRSHAADEESFFAKQLAAMADGCANDACGSAHRAHLLTEGITVSSVNCAPRAFMRLSDSCTICN